MKRELNVYLCGNLAGTLYEDELLQLSFKYHHDDAIPILSVNLPVKADEYSHAYAYPFFENLSPEGEAFDILVKDHVSGNKIFSILDRFGGDCAGAVAFYETMPKDIDKTLHEISSAKLVQIIDKLPEDPLLSGLENPPRLSLAGAQSKFAVHKIEDKYYRSDDEHPTTHIIKITNKRFPNLLTNEFFCMRLAQIMNFDIPDVELKVTKDNAKNTRAYLEIQRFDRYIENGIVRRIHQEDFCQALGIVSDKKYQVGGGASLKDCCMVINKFSTNQLTDITRFMEWIIFNYLIGNTDAHAKNLSLLHTSAGIKLAPFYDLLSTEIYPEKIIDYNMAMLINGKGKYDSLKPKDFTALFEQLRLNPTNMMKILKSRFVNIIPLAENLRDNISDNAVCDNIIAIMKRRWDLLFG
ncbi:MAG: type II toxin-antitoxin system HipA family toxin [Treponema sp.]|nr:type II toxin-antitoxin system HipA family toxin [Treponema sp.]